MDKYDPITVGIPTYNRGDQLRKSLNSLLIQTYSNMSVIVSDNNSTDNTNTICNEFKKQIKNFQYIKQKSNIGALNNFKYLFEKCNTKYFMWLADDDYIDENYISKCMRYHLIDEFALVSGIPIYYIGGVKQFKASPIQLLESNKIKRTIKFFNLTRDNGVFYGVYNKELIKSINIPLTWAGDQIFIGHVAYRGKIKTNINTRIHRSLDGTSQSIKKVVKTFSLHPINIYFPHVVMSYDIYKYFKNYVEVSKYNSFLIAAAYTKKTAHYWFIVPMTNLLEFIAPTYLLKMKRIIYLFKQKI